MALLLIYFLFRLIKSQCFPCCKFTNTTGRSSISQLTIQVKILRKKSRFLRNINNLGMLHVFLSKTTGGCVRKKYDNLKRPNWPQFHRENCDWPCWISGCSTIIFRYRTHILMFYTTICWFIIYSTYNRVKPYYHQTRFCWFKTFSNDFFFSNVHHFPRSIHGFLRGFRTLHRPQPAPVVRQWTCGGGLEDCFWEVKQTLSYGRYMGWEYMGNMGIYVGYTYKILSIYIYNGGSLI